ncbi:hypothetical protein [Bacillus toyonensis]|uniref:hypothetical protein n=1 Tax=Bacillus toyonensis TaxID=155322 RepID=UPI000BED1B41|nr:hypothetical protein [Bacillus toyonensis]PDY88622.1 hypothetical protein CON67_17350 [Bacillus toyonensis]PEK11872.1 hypothetical protein CN681_07350 [Bacillus toyonensis]PEM20684.1 hypothetical protein CN616_06995 [Bacillus toyonensis]PFZ76473.1 hypothetical protein COL82_17945 [Bacillus toyonensis]PGA03495.1 hypothetical protein COL67_24425 [Bacillus toyonensis]
MKIFVVKAIIEGESECVLMGAYPTLTEANKRVEELTKKYKQDKEHVIRLNKLNLQIFNQSVI